MLRSYFLCALVSSWQSEAQETPRHQATKFHKEKTLKFGLRVTSVNELTHSPLCC